VQAVSAMLFEALLWGS